MSKFSRFVGCVMIAMLLQSCESTSSNKNNETMHKVGKATWKTTKAVGYGFGFVTEKLGQGIALAGRGLASGGSSLRKASQ